MVMINATIWCELYVDSQHRTNDEYSYNLLEVFLSWKEVVWGGAPPHKNNLIGTAAHGWTQIELFKMNTTAFSRSFFFSLADLLEASASSSLVALEALDPRLTIRLTSKTLDSAH